MFSAVFVGISKMFGIKKRDWRQSSPSSEPRGKYNKSILSVFSHNRQSQSWNAAAWSHFVWADTLCNKYHSTQSPCLPWQVYGHSVAVLPSSNGCFVLWMAQQLSVADKEGGLWGKEFPPLRACRNPKPSHKYIGTFLPCKQKKRPFWAVLSTCLSVRV